MVDGGWWMVEGEDGWPVVRRQRHREASRRSRRMGMGVDQDVFKKGDFDCIAENILVAPRAGGEAGEGVGVVAEVSVSVGEMSVGEMSVRTCR
jgi:hypothetical protein